MRVEISVESLTGVKIAKEAGANRIELCGALTDGGLTPSEALIELASELIETHVLIRPRPGDFRYSRDEIAVMLREIEMLHLTGAKGIVIGALGEDGLLDPMCDEFVEAADGLPVTLHRAIDVSASSERVLDQAADLGFARVLTSGRQRSAVVGAALIKSLVAQAGSDIEVMACGAVRASNALEVIAATGVSDLHAAPRTPVAGVPGGVVSYAGAGVPEGFDHFETDAVEVAALCSVIRG
jgi:copper homeostasis protein